MRAFIVACLVIGGCGYDNSSMASAITLPLVGPSPDRPSEKILWDISVTVSSFAGYYCYDGNLVALLAHTDNEIGDETSLRSAIDPALVARCGSHRMQDRKAELVIASTNYPFTTLSTWRDAISQQFLDLPGAVSIGIDYQRNVIQLGVGSGSDMAEVAAIVSAVNIPEDGYSISVEDPPVDIACPDPSTPTSVYDCYRSYIPGGVQISTKPFGGVGSGASCSMGPTAYYWDGSAWYAGWVTASHCVGWWGNQSWYVYQNFSSASPSDNLVGLESMDPPGYTCGSRTCRHSDAAWVWATQVPPDEGTIVQPVSWSSPSNVLVYPPTSRFVVDTWTWSTQGFEVEKVGSSTGWTTGFVTAVCVDINVTENGQPVTKLCNDKATLGALEGDSGSPTFLWGSGDHVTLLGVNWGRSGTTTYYSQWAGVISDMTDFWITP
jgi:hypothetical protein